MNYGYAVVTINQASRQAESVDGVFWSESESEVVADQMREAAREVGRGERFVVCKLVEVGESDD